MAIESPDTTLTHEAAPSMRAASNLRVWPALILVAAYWMAYAVVTIFYPATFTQFLTLFWAPQVLAPLVLVWWFFFSRLPWLERYWGIGWTVLAGLAAAFLLGHKSMMMGMVMYAAPVAITAVVLTLAVFQTAVARVRWAAVAVAAVLGWGYFTLIRVDGVTGDLRAERSWRWSPTAEDRFLAERKTSKSTGVAVGREANHSESSELVATQFDWPEFRGANRDGHLHHVSLNSDWASQPPRELWRRRVGPGWSSFAVVGDRAFTQEQRGENEAVACLDVATGQELWSHEDKVRFEETVGGAGPRATPTFHGGKIYSQGGSGVVNCLDAASGKVIWSHRVTENLKDTKTGKELSPPMWGYACSPLATHGVAIVFAGGKDGNSVLAYDSASGELRWSAGKGWHSYSSPQLVKIGGEDHVLMVSERGVEAFDPDSGKLLWEHDWNLKDMFRVCQPHAVGDSQVLIGTPMMEGTRLLTVIKDGGTWTAKEEWTTKDLKPYFNDLVQLGDHIYGFDSDILVCIDLASGKRKWKKGRYGHGQALLVGESGQLLVVSDQGELILTEVSPTGLKELAKIKALTGKTWNHPVITGNKLLVRNGEEMACFELAIIPASDAHQPQ